MYTHIVHKRPRVIIHTCAYCLTQLLIINFVQYLEAAYGHEQAVGAQRERGKSKAINLLDMLTKNGGMLMVGLLALLYMSQEDEVEHLQCAYPFS